MHLTRHDKHNENSKLASKTIQHLPYRIAALCLMLALMSSLAVLPACASATDGGSEPITVSLSITCHEAIEAGSETAETVSDDGVIYEGTVEINAGDSVYDALMASGVVVNSNQSSMGAYVSAIGGLAEKDTGKQSGWKYLVNGESASVSCNEYELEDGDRVEWQYALEP